MDGAPARKGNLRCFCFVLTIYIDNLLISTLFEPCVIQIFRHDNL